MVAWKQAFSGRHSLYAAFVVWIYKVAVNISPDKQFSKKRFGDVFGPRILAGMMGGVPRMVERNTVRGQSVEIEVEPCLVDVSQSLGNGFHDRGRYGRKIECPD